MYVWYRHYDQIWHRKSLKSYIHENRIFSPPHTPFTTEANPLQRSFPLLPREKRRLSPKIDEDLLQLAETGAGGTSLGGRGGAGGGNVLALEVGQEGGVAGGEGAGAAERVDDAGTAQVGRADGVGGGVGGGEQLALDVGQDGRGHVLEDVALGQDHGARVDLEGVVGRRVPVVVDGVQERVAGDLGAAARGVVDVVVLEGHQVARAGEVQRPVVVGVAGGRPRRAAVDLAVGNGHAVGGRVSEDNVLAADEGGLCG